MTPAAFRAIARGAPRVPSDDVLALVAFKPSEPRPEIEARAADCRPFAEYALAMQAYFTSLVDETDDPR